MLQKPLHVSVKSFQNENGSPMMDYSLYTDSQNNPFIELYNWRVNLSRFFDSYKNNGNTNALNDDIAANVHNSTTMNYSENEFDESLSMVWYFIAFAALIMFFLLISFSEVCCKKSFSSKPPENEIEVPPPPYDLFAPPTYDSLYKKKTEKKIKIKRQLEVFVIPVFGDKISLAISTGEPQRNPSGSGVLVTPEPPP